MSSAFRRKGATRPGSLGSSTIQSPSSSLLSATRGIKAWTGGIHLTSVGLNDLDTILGGGQPLGTSILLQEDRWTRDLALSLLKYWVAEVSTIIRESSFRDGFLYCPKSSYIINLCFG